MAAFDPATLDRWRALAIVDRDGATVGTIKEFYLDRETGYPTWALVNTGLFGATQTFVPLVHATEISDGLQVPYEKSHIKDTPKVDLHDELSPEEEAELFTHYGVEYQPSADAGSDAQPDPWIRRPRPGLRTYRPKAQVQFQPMPGPRARRRSLTGRRLGRSRPNQGQWTLPRPARRPTAAQRASGDSVDGRRGPSRAGHHQESNDGRPGPSRTPSDPTQRTTPQQPSQRPPHSKRPTRRCQAEPGTTEPDGTTRPDPDLDPERSRPEPHDPDLARTAPVEPGLPGSTASSPYGTRPDHRRQGRRRPVRLQHRGAPQAPRRGRLGSRRRRKL